MKINSDGSRLELFQLSQKREVVIITLRKKYSLAFRLNLAEQKQLVFGIITRGGFGLLVFRIIMPSCFGSARISDIMRPFFPQAIPLCRCWNWFTLCLFHLLIFHLVIFISYFVVWHNDLLMCISFFYFLSSELPILEFIPIYAFSFLIIDNYNDRYKFSVLSELNQEISPWNYYFFIIKKMKWKKIHKCPTKYGK